VVFIERDASGAAFVRVQEQAWSPFDAAPAQATLADRQLGPAPGSNNVIEGPQTTFIKNIDVVQMKHGLTLQASAMVDIYDYTYTQFDGAGAIYGAAIKLGDNGRPTNGPTYIQRVVADGMQAPDATYKISNNDFLGVETDSGEIYLRDVTGKNFGDAGVDTKSTQVYIMNATLSNAHRMVRAWPNVEIILVNSIINAAPGHAQGWVYDGSSTIRYYNTLWCVNAAAPSKASCTSSPTVVEGETISASEAASRFIALQSNPLPGISPFFKTDIEEIVVEYSADGGTSWQAMALANAGAAGSAPVGDTRYAIPFDLDGGDYRFRAFYKKLGVKVGETSAAVNEAGGTV
jgi:hypothetical protein